MNAPLSATSYVVKISRLTLSGTGAPTGTEELESRWYAAAYLRQVIATPFYPYIAAVEYTTSTC